jgi:polar amino acid transport system substrate-binding protein
MTHRPGRRWPLALLYLAVSARAAMAQDLPQEVRIASEGARPPYNYFDGTELAGFEIDLGHELCARIKLKCTFVAQDWESLIPGLLGGNFDAIMAALDITEERQAKIAFSKPYIRMPSAFLVARNNDVVDPSPDGLKGKTIGFETGGAHQAYVEDMYKGSTLHAYASLEEAILDLAQNRVDVVIGDKDALSDFLKTRKEGQCCQFLADVPRDPAYFGEGIGIGLRKQDRSLKTAFDQAIDSVLKDGTYARIKSKYFDFDIY